MKKTIEHIAIDDFSFSVLRLGDGIADGNKYYKLKYNLEKASVSGYKTIVTMGGPYSNHIAAVAQMCTSLEFNSIGIIRGESVSNNTLQRAAQDGMQLHFVSREKYREYRDIRIMEVDFPGCYYLGEGGSGDLAVKGCAGILENADHDIIAVAVGTGATLAGITTSLKEHQKALGIVVLKNGKYIESDVENWLHEYELNGSYQLNHDYHGGGYAKTNAEINAFVHRFNNENAFRIEPIYTGKLFYGLYDLHRRNYFKPNASILAVHTGGMQYLGAIT